MSVKKDVKMPVQGRISSSSCRLLKTDKTFHKNVRISITVFIKHTYNKIANKQFASFSNELPITMFRSKVGGLSGCSVARTWLWSDKIDWNSFLSVCIRYVTCNVDHYVCILVF